MRIEMRWNLDSFTIFYVSISLFFAHYVACFNRLYVYKTIYVYVVP